MNPESLVRSSPRVSVCVPTYNHGIFLPDAIESVLGQTLSDFELIVVDNDSADDTENIVRHYCLADRRVKYRRNDHNIGLSNNFNRCIESASGTYIKILCADDVLEQACLEESVRILESHPEVSLVSTARLLVREDLRPIRLLAYSDRFCIESGAGVIGKCLFRGNMIGEPTAALFRKSQSGRGFNTEYRHLLDLEMWFHLLEQGDFAFLPEPLCKFRQHEGQATKGNVSSLVFLEEQRKIVREFIDKDYLGISPMEKWFRKLLYSDRLKLVEFGHVVVSALSGLRKKGTGIREVP